MEKSIKLTWKERVGYCSGEIAQNLIYQTVSIWLLFYCFSQTREMYIRLATAEDPQMPMIIEHLTTDREYSDSVAYVKSIHNS